MTADILIGACKWDGPCCPRETPLHSDGAYRRLALRQARLGRASPKPASTGFPHKGGSNDLLPRSPARRTARRNSRYLAHYLRGRQPAQQQAPLPPGSPLIGSDRIRKPQRSWLRLRRRRSPTAPDQLPTAKLKAPAGFKIEVYTSGVTNARMMRQGDKGTVFVSSRVIDKVYAIVEKNGKREVKVIASGLHRPNGIAFHKGTLYIAELYQISKIENIEANLDNPPKPTVIYNDLPKDEAHGWKFLAVGPDNKLYFQVGAPCNICMPPPTHAQTSAASISTAAAWRWWRAGSGRSSGWTSILPRQRCALFHRKQPRLAVGGHPAGQAQPGRQSGQGQFRFSVLPSG